MPQTLETSSANLEGSGSAIEQMIQAAIAQARAACQGGDATASECAVAWDIVEELQAAKSHRDASNHKTSLQRYCDENPDADECRIYDV